MNFLREVCMTIRAICSSMAVRGCVNYASSTSSITRTGKSIIHHFCTDLKHIDDRSAGKSLLDTNWRKREIKILHPLNLATDPNQDLSLHKEDAPLTYEAYKKKHLQTFREFYDENKDFYNIEEI